MGPSVGSCSPRAPRQIPVIANPAVSRPGSAERAVCDENDDTSVRVALKARPLVPRERLEGAKTCLTVDEASRAVVLGSQRQFAFDYAFGPHSTQDQVYETCVSDLVDAVVEGYNATVLAYGPTGSGKTYTIGTGSALHCMPEQQGIIPRVIRRLFDVIQHSSSDRSFVVRAQFLEIYNEELRDLLAPPGSHTGSNGGAAPFSSSPGNAFSGCSSESGSGGRYGPVGTQRSSVAIRECPDGQIVITGAREEVANSYADLVHLLDCGALARATGATALNEQSSRSHAIFTIIVEQSIRSNAGKPATAETAQQASNRDSRDSSALAGRSPATSNSGSRPMTPRARLLQHLNHSGHAGASADTADSSSMRGSNSPSSDRSSKECFPDDVWGSGCGDSSLQMEYRCAKFHLVDLAGSERTKRSGAVGARFKETVTINQGLLALGNVISALADDKRRLTSRHVPYRDSKLTRLLQDSLGGNSKTLMIACVSSADDVLEENLNTLKYASRARRIRNRPVVHCHKLGSSTGGVAADVQALQLLLLRRFTHQVLGPLTARTVPESLLADAALCSEASSVRLLRELQALATVPKAALSAGVMHDIHLCDQEQQQHNKQLDMLTQQVADLEAQLTSARMQAAAFEMQLDFAANQQVAAEQAAAEAHEQQKVAEQQLLAELEQLHAAGRIGPAVRNQLTQLVQKVLKPPDTGQTDAAETSTPGHHVRRGSIYSHPLPAIDMSCCDEGLTDAIRAAAAKASRVSSQAGDREQELTALKQELHQTHQQLAEAAAQLEGAQQDLARDEEIFAQRVMEMAKLRDEMAVMVTAAQQERAAAATQIQHLQADLRRWRTRALALQGCPNVDTTVASRAELSQASATGRASDSANPASPDSLVGELSFAAFTRLQQQQQTAANATAATGGQQPGSTLQEASSLRANLSEVNSHSDIRQDDEVLFDDELASYISETDYTDLATEESHHLLAELQAVLADKAALEQEKATAQAEAADAQRSFERSRALLESQLTQLSSAISSQEMLISTLQSNEAQAREMGALYLERCRELETELAELQLDLEELTAALAQVEADAAASAEEKQLLRTEYEGKILAVLEQMSGLQRQLKGQDLSRIERERQRAAQQVQQLQTHLTAMRAEQDALRKRLQERLLAQEKAAADKSKEMAALRRAADAAKKRITELEEQNKRQRAELKAKAVQAATAQKQLRQLETQASLGRSRQAASPRASPRANGAGQSPRRTSSSGFGNSSNTSRASTLDRTHSGKIFKHGVSGRRPSRQPSPIPISRTGSAVEAVGDAASTAEAAVTLEQPQDASRHGGLIQLSSTGLQGQQDQEHVLRASGDGAQQLPGAVGSKLHSTGSVSSSIGSRQQLITVPATARSSLCSSSLVSLPAGIKISTWLKSQLQLLAVKQTAEDQLQLLQVRREEAAQQREQLLGAKAALHIKQLRRAGHTTAIRDAAERCPKSGTGSSSGATDTDRGVPKQRSQLTDPSAAEQSMLDGLTDQLDAASAELEHIQQQMQQQQAQISAADEAVAQLRAQMPHMSSEELAALLQQALDVLVEQGSQYQAVTCQVSKLELELIERQQQLEETASCLHSTQLQHQAQLAGLQQQHEQKLMELFKQSAAAAGVSTPQNQARQQVSCSTSSTLSSGQHKDATTAAAGSLLATEKLHNFRWRQREQQSLNPESIAATVAAVFSRSRSQSPSKAAKDASPAKARGSAAEAGSVDSKSAADVRSAAVAARAESPASTGSPQQVPGADHRSSSKQFHSPVRQSRLTTSNSAAGKPRLDAANPQRPWAEPQQGAEEAAVQIEGPQQQQLSAGQEYVRRISSFSSLSHRSPRHYRQLSVDTTGLGQPSLGSQSFRAAGVEAVEPVQRRMSPRQGSPTRGPQLADLMACLAQRPSSRQQQHEQKQQLPLTDDDARQSLSLKQQEEFGVAAQRNEHCWQVAQSMSSSNSSPNRSMLAGQRLQQEDSPSSSASKLQAKLAAYRSYLRHASPHKQASSSSPVGSESPSIRMTGSVTSSPGRLGSTVSRIDSSLNTTEAGPAAVSEPGTATQPTAARRLQCLIMQPCALAQSSNNSNSTVTAAAPDASIGSQISSKRQSGGANLVPPDAKERKDWGAIGSSLGGNSSADRSRSSLVSSSITNSLLNRASRRLAAGTNISNEVSRSCTALGNSQHGSPITRPLGVSLRQGNRESGWDGRNSESAVSAAKLAAAAAALLRDAGVESDADDHDQLP